MRKLLLLFVPVPLLFMFPACDDDAGGTTVGATSTATTGAGGSGANGGMSSTGGTSSAGGSGGTTSAGGAGGMLNCPEMGPGEPDNTEATATKLADVADDCDGNGGSVLGTLTGDSDVDWYYYESLNDDGLCQIDPTRAISQSGMGALELCKYVECVEGGYPNINANGNDCLNGSTYDVSPAGRPGCCGTVGFEIDLPLNPCTMGNGDDHLFVYMKVSEPGAQADNCNQYNITYHL
jgi:hypothetical protein